LLHATNYRHQGLKADFTLSDNVWNKQTLLNLTFCYAITSTATKWSSSSSSEKHTSVNLLWVRGKKEVRAGSKLTFNMLAVETAENMATLNVDCSAWIGTVLRAIGCF